MITKDFEYSDEYGHYLGYLAYEQAVPADERRPGVLVFPEAWGLSRHAMERAEMLARLGYVALAADYYGGRQAATKLEEAHALIGRVMAQPKTFHTPVRSAFDALANLPQVDPARIGGIGFCLGGLAVLELVRTGKPLAAGVALHSTLKPLEPDASVDRYYSKARVLICNGTEDPVCPLSEIDGFQKEMDAANVDYQINIYGRAKHSFANPYVDMTRMEGMAYSPRVDRRSWHALSALFEETFSGVDD
jgi:dienelactone hydrolase